MAPEGGVDREAWATLVRELLASETRGKKLPFARLIGRDARTVDRWLRCEVAVEEESVRAVARALNRPPGELLVRVGYYRPNDLVPEPPAKLDLYNDPVIKRIMEDPNLDEDTRLELVEVQARLIKEDRDRRQAEYDRLIAFRQGRRDAS
jgi:hypothetical protein